MLIAALLMLGALVAAFVASFAITVVVTAIVKSLRKSGNNKGVLLPTGQAKKVISAVGDKDPKLGRTLAEAFGDKDKLEFIFNDENEIVGAEKITARDTSVDDIQDVTAVFSSGRYKTYV